MDIDFDIKMFQSQQTAITSGNITRYICNNRTKKINMYTYCFKTNAVINCV